MIIKPIMVPSIRIDWGQKPKTEEARLTLELNGDSYHDNVIRLEAKYNKALSKKQMARELNISEKKLAELIIEGRDLPDYVERASGRHVFPIIEVAKYLSQGLVKTA